MSEFDGFDGIEQSVGDLNQTLDQTAGLVSGFDGELRRMRSSLAGTNHDVAALDKGLSRGLRKAFDGVFLDGMKLSDALNTVAQSMIKTTYNAAIKPVTDHFGGMIAAL